MKRFLFTIALMAALVVFIEPVRNLVGEMLKLEAPTTHQIERGNWLSKLALENYGDASYWRELALVNRVPNPDLIFPEEEVIIPSFEAMQKVRKARSLSTVNGLVNEQETIIASRMESPREPVAKNQQKDSMTNEERSLSGSADEKQATQDSTASAVNGIATERPNTEPESYPASGDGQQATTGQDPESFLSSTPVLTGLVILGVIVVIAILMAKGSRRRNEDETARRPSSRTGKDADAWQSERDKYTYQDENYDDNANGSKKRKKESEILH